MTSRSQERPLIQCAKDAAALGYLAMSRLFGAIAEHPKTAMAVGIAGSIATLGVLDLSGVLHAHYALGAHSGGSPAPAPQPTLGPLTGSAPSITIPAHNVPLPFSAQQAPPPPAWSSHATAQPPVPPTPNAQSIPSWVSQASSQPPLAVSSPLPHQQVVLPPSQPAPMPTIETPLQQAINQFDAEAAVAIPVVALSAVALGVAHHVLREPK